MAQMKTPGVYIQEKNAFATTVVEAATAIPAFIGITEKAVNGTENLTDKPQKITSMAEFNQYFGGAPQPKFSLKIDDVSLGIELPEILYTLYYNMVMFFANGGGTCYIVSVGNYDSGQVSKGNVNAALNALKKVREVTMIVVPEAVNSKDCNEIQQSVISHCGVMQNRFAILDVKHNVENSGDSIDAFQTAIGTNYLSYGAAYYPYLNTSVLSDKDIDYSYIKWEEVNSDALVKLLNKGKGLDTSDNSKNTAIAEYAKKSLDDIKAKEEAEKQALLNSLHNALLQNCPQYKAVVKKIKDTLNCLPPSAAIAGLYTMVDNTRGVWKSPANVSINYVNSLTENIDDLEQGDMNMPMNGKAINAIRVFPGEGIKVWGARTLDGNSQDWRYVNVRRTMLFIEESVKNAAKAYVFEPNVANTWLNMKSMIGSFLRGVWKRGGLAGATPEDSYQVQIGLGETMNEDDILNGIMRVTVLVAVTRPAEFIEITFQQQVQKS